MHYNISYASEKVVLSTHPKDKEWGIKLLPFIGQKTEGRILDCGNIVGD
jgi:hypothetical protein